MFLCLGHGRIRDCFEAANMEDKKPVKKGEKALILEGENSQSNRTSARVTHIHCLLPPTEYIENQETATLTIKFTGKAYLFSEGLRF